jgi:hypothetical protein
MGRKKLEDRFKRTLTLVGGKSLSITLPKEYLQALGWERGHELNVRIDKKREHVIIDKNNVEIQESPQLIRLELNSLELDLSKNNWNLYFIIVTEHPTNVGDWLVSVLPEDHLIKIRKPADNKISFEPQGEHVEGMLILEREMPADKNLKTRLWLMHSRSKTRNTGEILQELNEALTGSKVLETVQLLGNSIPWIVVSKIALPFLAERLKKAKDRDLGFVSLDENFKNQNAEEDRSNALSTGLGKVKWSWLYE